MNVKDFKKQFKDLRKNLIAAIESKCNGMELEFVHAIEWDGTDPEDPILLQRVRKGSIVIGDSFGEDTVKLTTLTTEYLLDILKELEDGHTITYSKEVTE